jgi:TIR domain/Cyclic nucleotide-binding domain
VTGQDTPEVPGHAFISYVREDANRVKRLVRILEAARIKVWQDTADILPGQDWKNAIKDAIKTGSLAFIACFSENSQQRQKTFQNEELILAAEEMRQHQYGVTWLIPVRFADCDIPAIDLGNDRTLRSLHRVDLFGRTWELGAVRLTDAVHNILGAPAATGTEPLTEDPDQAAEADTEQSAVPFWDFLNPTERDMLRAVASVGTFAKGAIIMRQGEPADHVIVILGGKAGIRVNENGGERELVKRSEGQLIGERAALRVSTRSATVIALEKITALVVQTRDFATFLSDTHPRILAFVQDQRHARGIDEPGGYDARDPAGSHGAPADGTATGQPTGGSARHEQSLNGENCTVIFTDVVAFGAHKRIDTDRSIIRKALYSMMQTAMQGFPGARLEDRGDGVLIVIPPDVSTARAMDQLLRVLPRALDRHNSSHRNPAQFQLRLSVNVGPVRSDSMGVAGEAIIVAARMVEARAFKEAFTGSTACLGIIVSPFVYDTVVRHDQDQHYVASYSPVHVEVKEFRTTAWMMLID